MSRMNSRVGEVLKAELGHRKQLNSSYSLRAFARDGGISNAYLSQVMSGKKTMSEALAFGFAKKLSLGPKLTQHLLQCARLDAAASKGHKALIEQEWRKTKKPLQFHVLKANQFNIISEWYSIAILALTQLESFRNDLGWISRKLKISRAQAQSMIDRLLKLDLLRHETEQEEGRLTCNPKNIKRPSTPDKAVREHHLAFLDLAKEALSSHEFNTRDISGSIMPISAAQYPEIKKRIQEFREEIIELTEKHPAPKDSVYRLSVQFFRLDQPEVK